MTLKNCLLLVCGFALGCGATLSVSPEDVASAASQSTVKIDDSTATANYANFCRVTGTPEEVIFDFGLNPQPFGDPTKPIPVKQQIITNFFTAKRLLNALQMTVERHEATFGVLERDVQKRMKSQ
jgi:hypothetical protein